MGAKKKYLNRQGAKKYVLNRKGAEAQRKPILRMEKTNLTATCIHPA